jgi:hypothetical protein
MTRLVMLVRFRDQATPPEGDPPRFNVRGESEQIRFLEGVKGALPERAAVETQVTMTGETSFVEDAIITFDGEANRLRTTTVGEGTLAPSAEEGVLHGSVMWRVEQGEGRLSGCTGLVASNFAVQADTGEATEYQVIWLFLP